MLPDVKASLQRYLSADFAKTPAEELLRGLPDEATLPRPEFDTLAGPSLYERWLEGVRSATRTSRR